MKNLLIMRHAKSSWDSKYRNDFERPLNKRGAKDAPRMGEFLARREVLPDFIVCSPAERAKLTATLVGDACGFDGDLIFDHRIYEAAAGQLMEVIHDIPDESDTVMLIGHNPGFEELIEVLCGGNLRMPTGAIAYIEAWGSSWQAVAAQTGTLQWFVTPKLLKKLI